MPKLNETILLTGETVALTHILYEITKDISSDNVVLDFMLNLVPIATPLCTYLIPRGMKLYGYIFEKDTPLADDIIGFEKA